MGNERKMKIQIVGMGIVGTAQAMVMRCLGHEVSCVDTNKDVEIPSFVKRCDDYSDADFTFICTPESAVPNIIEQLTRGKFAGLYIIKSTVKPGTTQGLMRTYGTHICHNPEFLRERHCIEDALNPSRIIIGGCCSDHTKELAELYGPINSVTVTTPTMSELMKLAVNALRSDIITFWNEMAELCGKLDINVDELSRLVETDKTIGTYEGGNWGTRFFGVPFGGKCLPKDLIQLKESFRANGLNPLLLDAIELYNERLKGGEQIN